MKVKVIKSAPADKGQCGIESIIGEIFEVKQELVDFENQKTGEVQVWSKVFGGFITLNKDEYEIVN